MNQIPIFPTDSNCNPFNTKLFDTFYEPFCTLCTVQHIRVLPGQSSTPQSQVISSSSLLSIKANKQRCMFPFTSVFLILQFGCLWSSLTSCTNYPSSLEDAILDRWKHERRGYTNITIQHITTKLILPLCFPSPLERKHKCST